MLIRVNLTFAEHFRGIPLHTEMWPEISFRSENLYIEKESGDIMNTLVIVLIAAVCLLAA